MFYELRDMQRAMLKPLSNLARATGALCVLPGSPLSGVPFSRSLAAGLELFHRLTRSYEKPPFGIDSVTVDGCEVPVTERVVLAKPFCRLVRFERLMPQALAGRPVDPVVLVFAPLSGHFATLLRDTVRTMLPEHDVYVTDWIDARQVPLSAGPFHLDDYVAYAMEFIRCLGPAVNVMAVCQPTVPVLGAVSLLATLGDPHQVRSMTLMGGPIDARRSPTQVTELAVGRPLSWFEDNLVHRVPPGNPGAGRRVYPGFLQLAAFMAMNPSRHAEAYRNFYFDVAAGREDRAAAHRRFYDEYNAVLDMPAEYYLETVKLVFQEFALAKGEWTVHLEGRDIRVAPEDVRETALFTIEGEKDDISGLGQTEAAQALCGGIPQGRRRHLVAAGVGHYGLFSGSRWRERIYPEVRAFIRAS
jgi:poly(3-hydroxybutyrate) depolymerase